MSSILAKQLDATKLEVACVCLTGLFAMGFGAVFGSLFVGGATAICGFALCAAAVKFGKSPTITVLASVSFSIGLLIATAIYFGYIADYGVPYWVPGSDDMMLESDARQCVAKDYHSVYDMVNGDTSREKLHNTKGYVIFLAYLMRIGDMLGGYHTMVPRIVNIFLLNISALLIVRMFVEKHNGGMKQAHLLLTLIALFPNSLYIASHVYRDVMAAFFLVALYYLFDRKWEASKVVGYVFIAVLLLYCAYWIRESLLVFSVGIILVSMLFKLPRKTRRRQQIKVISFAIVTVCIVVAVFALSRFGSTIVYYLTRYTERLSSSESGIVAAIYSLPLLPIGIPARFAAYLVTPFYYGTVFNINGWFVSTYSICNVVTSLGTVYLVSQYYYLLKGWLANRKAVVTTALLVLGISLTTFGYRHVVMVYPFLLFAIVDGKSFMGAFDTRKRFAQPTIIGCLFVAFFAILYIA